jgi:hypothetical protein
MQRLELSAEARLEDPPELILPEDRRLPLSDLRRGRGALLGLALLGLVLFFTPWVEIIRPETEVRSGFELARGRAGWLWGGATGYFVLLPLVVTRRTIARMRGVRIACVLLASMTLFEVLTLLALPPRQGLIPVTIEWKWGLYASGVVSLVASMVSARFGGSLPPLPPDMVEGEAARTPLARPSGETLH